MRARFRCGRARRNSPPALQNRLPSWSPREKELCSSSLSPNALLSLRPAEQAPLAPRGERGPSSCSATGAPTPEGEEEEQEGRKRWLLLLLPRRCSQKNRRRRRMLHFSPTSPASWPRPLPSSLCGLRTGHSSSQTSGTSKRNGERRKREQRRGRKFGKGRTKSTDEFRELSAETSLTLVPPPGTLSSTPPLEPKQQDRLRPLVCVWPRGPSFSRRRRRGKRGVGRGEEKAALPLACFVALLRSRSVVGAPLARTEEVGEQKSFLFRGPHPFISPLFHPTDRAQVCMTYVPSLSAIQIFTLDEDRWGIWCVFWFGVFFLRRRRRCMLSFYLSRSSLCFLIRIRWRIGTGDIWTSLVSFPLPRRRSVDISTSPTRRGGGEGERGALRRQSAGR